MFTKAENERICELEQIIKKLLKRVEDLENPYDDQEF